MIGHGRPRVLFVALEFSKWKQARAWTYSAQLGIEEGLRANGVEYVTIATPWLSRAREICGGKRFDQVWLEIVHSDIEETFLDWIASLAPVRVGFIPESFEYTAEECARYPILRERRSEVEGKFRHLTHVLAVDENDVDSIGRLGYVQALWWPPAVPERFISRCVTVTPVKRATFSGRVYFQRKTLLELPELKGLLVREVFSERGTGYPTLHNLLHFAARWFLGEGNQDDSFIRSICEPVLRVLRRRFGVRHAFQAYMRALRAIRRRCFGLWLGKLQRASAVVNLPSMLKAYTGRVVEGMAAGRPVISWEIPGRPRARALFENGKEILLFPQDDPPQLAAHIRRILAEPDFGRQIAENARRKLLSFHTMERRVRQVLDWIGTGKAPAYH